MSRKQSLSKKSSSRAKSRIIRAISSSSDDEVDDKEIFEVECILDKRILAGKVSVRTHTGTFWLFFLCCTRFDSIVLSNGSSFALLIPLHTHTHVQPQYLIKYKGYDDSENTWEPPANLNCPKLIREFERDLLRKSQAPVVREYYEFERILAKRLVDGDKVSDFLRDLFLLFSHAYTLANTNNNSQLIDARRMSAPCVHMCLQNNLFRFVVFIFLSVCKLGRILGEMGGRTGIGMFMDRIKRFAQHRSR